MTQSKHTPGKWEVSPHPNKKAFEGNLIVSTQDTVDCDRLIVCTIWSCDKKEEHQANARLIAAAPELLEALKGIVWKMSNSDPNTNDGRYHLCKQDIQYKKAVEAIKKTKGQ